jgi:CRISPR system Cascade subunit CasE
MFLSYLLVDTAADPSRPRPVRSWIGRPYRVHQRLWMAFPSNRRRAEDTHFLAPFNPSEFAQHAHTPRNADAIFLFRVDPMPGVVPSRHGIVVQSAIKPDWDYAFHNAPEFLAAPPIVNSYRPSFALGQRLHFRLRANPTKRVAEKNERLGSVMAGKRVGLTSEAEQVRWLLRKGDVGGFRVPGSWVDANNPDTSEPVQLPNFRVNVIAEGRDRNGKPGCAGEFLAVRFEGLLEVTDPERFLQTVRDGLGSAKGFGFGLLSLAPEKG